MKPEPRLHDIPSVDTEDEFSKLPFTMLALWLLLAFFFMMVLAGALGFLDTKFKNKDSSYFLGVYMYVGIGVGCAMSAQILARMHHLTPFRRSLVVPPVVIAAIFVSFLMFVIGNAVVEGVRAALFPSMHKLDELLFWPKIGVTGLLTYLTLVIGWRVIGRLRRRNALKRIAAAADPDAVQMLNRAIDDPNRRIARRLVEELGQSTARGVMAPLLKALSRSDISDAAIKALDRNWPDWRSSKEASKEVEALEYDGAWAADTSRRSSVAKALGSIGSSSAAEVLIRMLEREGPAQYVVEALVATGDAAVPSLTYRLTREEPEVRTSAVDILKRIGPTALARSEIRKRIPSPYEGKYPCGHNELEVALVAAWLGDVSGIAMLKECATSWHDDARERAKTALATLGHSN